MEATNGIGLRWRLRNWSFFFIFRAEALADWRTSCHTAPGDLFGLSPLFFSQRGGRRGGFPPPFVFTVQWTLDELSRQLFSISPPFVFWAVAYDSSGLDWETAAAATVGTCCHANAPSDPRTDSSVWNNALCRKKKKIDIDLSGFVEKEKCSPCLRLVNADVTDVAAAAERVGTQELDGILIPVECVLTSRRIWVPLSLYVLLFAFRWPMQHILAYRERTSQFLFCFVTGICNDQNVYAQRVAPTPGLSDSDGARSLFFFFFFFWNMYTRTVYIYKEERERDLGCFWNGWWGEPVRPSLFSVAAGATAGFHFPSYTSSSNRKPRDSASWRVYKHIDRSRGNLVSTLLEIDNSEFQVKYPGGSTQHFQVISKWILLFGKRKKHLVVLPPRREIERERTSGAWKLCTALPIPHLCARVSLLFRTLSYVWNVQLVGKFPSLSSYPS